MQPFQGQGQVQVPLLVFEFVKYPIPDRIDFAAAFKAKTESTLQALQELTRLRNAFIPLLINNNDPHLLAKAVSEYLGKFVEFAAAISSGSGSQSPVQGQSQIKTAGPLQFYWTSAFSQNKTVRYMFYSYWFEIAMCHILLACANVNCAKRALARENIHNRLLEDIKLYHNLAAAAFLRAKSIVMDNWPAKNETRLPIDLRADILENVAQYSLGQAQLYNYVSAFAKGAYPIVGANAFFVEKCAENVKKALHASEEFMSNGDQGLLDFFCAQEIVCYAASCYANALDMKNRSGIEVLNTELTLGKIFKFAECATHALDVLFNGKGNHFEVYRKPVESFAQMCKDLHATCQKELNASEFNETVPPDLPKRQIAKPMLDPPSLLPFPFEQPTEKGE